MKPSLHPLALRFLAVSLAFAPAACSSTKEESRTTSAPQKEESKPRGKAQQGIASIYKDKRTASGERYSASALAAAHKHLPLGSKAKVTNLRNGKSVVVRINDRGPYIKGRIIDLTPAAAAKLGFGWAQGIARVKVERL
jgi:rare lipoprotein A